MTWEWVATSLSTLTLIGIGVTYGDVRARLGRIEKTIFNGQYVSKEKHDIEIGLLKEGMKELKDLHNHKEDNNGST